MAWEGGAGAPEGRVGRAGGWAPEDLTRSQPCARTGDCAPSLLKRQIPDPRERSRARGAWVWQERHPSPAPRSTARWASPAISSLFIHALLSFLSSPFPLSFFLLTALEDGGGTGGAHALRLRTHLPLPPPHR